MGIRGWSAVALSMLLPVMILTVSCAKKVVRTQTQDQTQTQAQPQPQAKAQPVAMTEPAVQKTPDRPAEEAKPDGRREEVRLRAEADARLAALTAFVGENIHFAFGSSQLSDQARQILHRKAEYLRTNPEIAVTVEGHCDDRGTNAFNIALGERRAESVKMFLVDLGIGTHRLKAVSCGEERPIAMGHNEDSWAKNRRAQFVIK